MAVWRAFYASYLDAASFRALAAARRDRSAEMAHFADSLRSAMLLSLACCAVLQVGGRASGRRPGQPACTQARARAGRRHSNTPDAAALAAACSCSAWGSW